MLVMVVAACGSSEHGSESTTVEKSAGAGGGTWTLTWSDEFNEPAGTKPDSARWTFEAGGTGGGNRELQLYTTSGQNASTDGDGHLVVTARKESPASGTCWYGACQYTSARISTRDKFSQAYGRFEARIEAPAGRGLQSAFWMLGDNNRRWPAQGEIDVMEILGQTPSTVHGSLIFSRNGTAGFRTGSYRLPAGQSFADGYHTFAIEWDPEAVRFYADDQLYATHTRASLPAGSTWAYDGPFYVIMDLGVGGVAAGRPDSSTVFPSQMKIDYVRVFKRSDGAAS